MVLKIELIVRYIKCQIKVQWIQRIIRNFNNMFRNILATIFRIFYSKTLLKRESVAGKVARQWDRTEAISTKKNSKSEFGEKCILHKRQTRQLSTVMFSSLFEIFMFHNLSPIGFRQRFYRNFRLFINVLVHALFQYKKLQRNGKKEKLPNCFPHTCDPLSGF